MGANRTSGLGMIMALSLLEHGFRDLASPIAFVRAGGFFENFLYGLQVARGGMLPVDLGVEGTEQVAGTTSARDVFAAAQKAVTAREI